MVSPELMNPVLPGSKVQNLGVAPCRQAEVSKPRKLGCRLAAQYAHGNRVIQIIVGQETWPAHGAAAPGTLLATEPLHHGAGILRRR